LSPDPDTVRNPGAELANAKTLAESKVGDKDLLEIKSQVVMSHSRLQSLSQIPPQVWNNPAQLQEVIKGNPKLLNQLLHQNPTLAEAVMSQGTFLLNSYFEQQRRARAEAKRKEEQQIAQLQFDPLDPSSQVSSHCLRNLRKRRPEIRHFPKTGLRGPIMLSSCRLEAQFFSVPLRDSLAQTSCFFCGFLFRLLFSGQDRRDPAAEKRQGEHGAGHGA
jgi:hypothetical protein